MRENTSVLVCLVIVAVMLVVATTIAISVFNDHHAYAKQNGRISGFDNSFRANNINKQKGSASGFDNTLEQEAQNFRANNLICTHTSSPC